MGETPTSQRQEQGRQLKAARIQAGKGQQEVADALGLVRSTVSRWERGASPVEVQHRKALAALYGADLSPIWGLGASSGAPGADAPALALEALDLSGRLAAFARGILASDGPRGPDVTPPGTLSFRKGAAKRAKREA